MSSRSDSTSDPPPGWLLRDGDVLAAVEERRGGWPRSFNGVVVVRSPALVHTLNCSSPLDVAWCNAGSVSPGDEVLNRRYEVRRAACLVPKRIGVPLLHGGALLVAPVGSFERWQLKVGDSLEIHRG
jgi:hypothetical protein